MYLVTSKKDGTEWALKESKSSFLKIFFSTSFMAQRLLSLAVRKDSYDLPLLEREILVMKDLHHPGLVQMKEAFHDKTCKIQLLIFGQEIFVHLPVN